MLVFDHIDHAGVTTEPPRSVPGEERLAYLYHLDRIRRLGPQAGG
jgi:hypothetical protein